MKVLGELTFLALMVTGSLLLLFLIWHAEKLYACVAHLY